MNRKLLSPKVQRIICICLLFFVIPGISLFAQSGGLINGGLSLDETLRNLSSAGAGNAELRWDPFFASGTFTVGQHEAAFISGTAGETGMVLLNRRDILTLPLPYLERGTIVFPEPFVNQVRNTITGYIGEEQSRFRIAAIIIDPGHGGRDPGAVYSYEVQGRTIRIAEKDIVLKVARQLHASLKASFPDKRVILTRDTDSTIRNEDRVDMANSLVLADNEMAIFISIHANASLGNRNARGFEVWYLSPTHRREVIDRARHAGYEEVFSIFNTMREEELSTQSIYLANNILRRIGEAVGTQSPNRGLKDYNWFVVRNAKMPSVLVELGFLSNREEALLLNSDAYLNKLSEALYKGTSDFIAFYERSGGFSVTR